MNVCLVPRFSAKQKWSRVTERSLSHSPGPYPIKCFSHQDNIGSEQWEHSEVWANACWSHAPHPRGLCVPCPPYGSRMGSYTRTPVLGEREVPCVRLCVDMDNSGLISRRCGNEGDLKNVRTSPSADKCYYSCTGAAASSHWMIIKIICLFLPTRLSHESLCSALSPRSIATRLWPVLLSPAFSSTKPHQTTGTKRRFSLELFHCRVRAKLNSSQVKKVSSPAGLRLRYREHTALGYACILPYISQKQRFQGRNCSSNRSWVRFPGNASTDQMWSLNAM